MKCSKINCPNRFVFGNENDEDAVSYVCMQCDKLVYDSSKRRAAYFRRLGFLLLTLLIIGVVGFMLSKNGNDEGKNSNNRSDGKDTIVTAPTEPEKPEKDTISGDSLDSGPGENKPKDIPPKKGDEYNEGNKVKKGGQSNDPDQNEQKPEKIPQEVVKTSSFYSDEDNDGLGDKNDKVERSSKPANYVTNSRDDCPTRFGPKSNNGCPVLSIKIPKKDIFINQRITLEADYDAKPSDNYKWECSGCSNKLMNSRSTQVEFEKVGSFLISVEVSNSDFKASTTESIFVKVPPSFLEEKFKDILKLAMYGTLPPSSSDKATADKSQDLINSFVSDKCKVVKEPNTTIVGNGDIKLFFGALRTPNIHQVYKNLHPSKLEVTQIDYDQNSGKIKKIYIAR